MNMNFDSRSQQSRLPSYQRCVVLVPAKTSLEEVSCELYGVVALLQRRS